MQKVLWYMDVELLHLSILVETMRREGYEITVGQPQVITKDN